MGDSTDSIRAGNVVLGFTAIIEGYDWILTSGVPSDASVTSRTPEFPYTAAPEL